MEKFIDILGKIINRWLWFILWAMFWCFSLAYSIAKDIDNWVEPDRLPPTKENCVQLFNSLRYILMFIRYCKTCILA